MQYTAGSFAGMVTEWFAVVLRPERHGHCPEGNFPGRADFEEHTPETVLERVIAPCARLVLWVSAGARGLQDGQTHSYILYLMVGLAGVAAMVLAWGQ